MDIKKMQLTQLMDSLSSEKFPNAASGSAAAISAAMGASLICMGCTVSLKKSENKDLLEQTKEEAKRIQKRCIELAEEDIDAYDDVLKAKRKKPYREEDYENAMREAVRTLVEVIDCCREILSLTKNVIPVCKRSLWGDLAAAAYLANGGAQTAELGIRINTGIFKDDHVREEIIREAGANRMSCKNHLSCIETMLQEGGRKK